MKIGILGGTFDPPHLGHLWLARTARQQLALDEVYLMPAAQNPLKRFKADAAPKHRLAMVEAMVKGEEGLAVSDAELTRGGPSYAVDTLDEFQMVMPGDYWFIMGADALASVEQWKNPAKLSRLCRLAVALRPPTTETQLLARIPELFKDKVNLVHMAPTEISATEIRERASRNLSLGGYVAPPVAAYIQKHKLYL